MHQVTHVVLPAQCGGTAKRAQRLKANCPVPCHAMRAVLRVREARLIDRPEKRACVRASVSHWVGVYRCAGRALPHPSR